MLFSVTENEARAFAIVDRCVSSGRFANAKRNMASPSASYRAAMEYLIFLHNNGDDEIQKVEKGNWDSIENLVMETLQEPIVAALKIDEFFIAPPGKVSLFKRRATSGGFNAALWFKKNKEVLRDVNYSIWGGTELPTNPERFGVYFDNWIKENNIRDRENPKVWEWFCDEVLRSTGIKLNPSEEDKRYAKVLRVSRVNEKKDSAISKEGCCNLICPVKEKCSLSVVHHIPGQDRHYVPHLHGENGCPSFKAVTV